MKYCEPAGVWSLVQEGLWITSPTSICNVEMLLHLCPQVPMTSNWKIPSPAPIEWPQSRLSQLLNILNVTAVESHGSLPQPVWAFVPTHPRPLSSEMPTSQRIRVKPASLRSFCELRCREDNSISQDVRKAAPVDFPALE